MMKVRTGRRFKEEGGPDTAPRLLRRSLSPVTSAGARGSPRGRGGCGQGKCNGACSTHTTRGPGWEKEDALRGQQGRELDWGGDTGLPRPLETPGGLGIRV